MEKAFTSKGYKQNKESLGKIKQKRLVFVSPKTKEKLLELFSGKQNSFFDKKHTNQVKEFLSQNRKRVFEPNV